MQILVLHCTYVVLVTGVGENFGTQLYYIVLIATEPVANNCLIMKAESLRYQPDLASDVI